MAKPETTIVTIPEGLRVWADNIEVFDGDSVSIRARFEMVWDSKVGGQPRAPSFYFEQP